MAKFGKSSNDRLTTCHDDLQTLFREVVKNYDCSILEGVRSLDRQKMLVNSGRSKTLNSRHLSNDGVSWAVDVVPYPIFWGDKERSLVLSAFRERNLTDMKKYLQEFKIVNARFYNFGGYVKGVADSLNIGIRWGGDWDGDNVFDDQSFIDLPHFELLGQS